MQGIASGKRDKGLLQGLDAVQYKSGTSAHTQGACLAAVRLGTCAWLRPVSNTCLMESDDVYFFVQSLHGSRQRAGC